MGDHAKHKSMIDQYANFGSTVYAPVQREGKFPDKRPKGQEVQTQVSARLLLKGGCCCCCCLVLHMCAWGAPGNHDVHCRHHPVT